MHQTELIVLLVPSIYDHPEKPLLLPPFCNMPGREADSESARLLGVIAGLNPFGGNIYCVDLTSRMNRKHFNLDSFMKTLTAPVFAVEAEERENVPAALQTAEVVKKHHPGSKTFFFGCAAASLNKELIGSNFVDAVLLSNLTEQSSNQIVKASTTGSFGQVCGLVWKDKRDRIRRNELCSRAEGTTLNFLSLYTGALGQLRLRHDFTGTKLLSRLLNNPVVYTSDRCCLNQALTGVVIQDKPSLESYSRSPEDVYRDIAELCRYTARPITIRGDILSPGNHFAERLLSLLQHKPAVNPLIFEFSKPIEPFIIQEIARSALRFRLKIAPGSHDDAIRRRIGREYPNAQLELTISEALKAGTSGVEIVFLAGLPGQTTESLFDTIGYCESLLRLFDGDRRLSLSVSPFSPPSSAGFGDLVSIGFVPRFRAFEEYLKALLLPGWNDRMEYCTAEMSSAELAAATYQSLSRLARLRAKYGQTTPVEAERAAAVFDRGMEMIRRIAKFENDASAEEIGLLGPEMASINRFSNGCHSAHMLPRALSRPQNIVVAGKALLKNYPWHRQPV